MERPANRGIQAIVGFVRPSKLGPEPLPHVPRLTYLTLDFNWSKGGFDAVMIANFTIKSTLQFQVRDIEIACTTAGASGTNLSATTKTIYDVVPAKATKRFSDVNMGFINTQSASANCRILSVH